MGIKEITRRIAMGGSVALATSGLTTCLSSGSVDPAPPPLNCNLDGGGIRLTATGNVVAASVVFEVRQAVGSGTPGRWSAAPGVTAVTGGSLRRTTVSQDNPWIAEIEIGLPLDDGGPGGDGGAAPLSGSFTVTGKLSDGAVSCAVQQTFHWTLMGDNVVVSMAADAIPLGSREPVRIAVVSRRGREVELRAHSSHRGARTLEWTITAGEPIAAEGNGFKWQLPDEPGIYQVELVMDYGEGGFAMDAVQIEVG